MTALDQSLTENLLGGVELSEPEQMALAAIVDPDATGEEIAKVVSSWMEARAFYTADPHGMGMEIDGTRELIEQIAVAAEEADKPLHRNSQRVDWANALGAGERAYVDGLRGTLRGIATRAKDALTAADRNCQCQREPGTNPDCPLHQFEERSEA